MTDWEEHEEEPGAATWDSAIFGRLLRYALRYRIRLVAGTLLVSLLAFLSILPPLLYGATVDLVFTDDSGLPARSLEAVLSLLFPSLGDGGLAALAPMARIWVVAAVFLFVRLAAFFVEWGNGYLLAGLGQRVIYDLRLELFRHVQRRSVAWFQASPVGRLVTRVANDVQALEELFAVALVTVFKDLGMLLGIVLVLLLLHVELGLISLSVIPFMVVAALVFRRASRAAYRRWRAALSRLNGYLAESLSGIRVVQLFGLEPRCRRDHDRLSREYKRHFLEQRRAWALFRPANHTLSAIGIGLVLWFGGGAAIRDVALPDGVPKEVTIGVLVAFLGFVQLFFTPIRDLTEKLDVIQGALTSAERIFGILDDHTEIPEKPDAADPGRLRGRVELRDVSFEYVPGEPVLRGVSLTIEPGRTVAVVGHTGGGKSTIINLLCRFWDVTSGSVRVDDADVRDLRLAALRRNIAVVHQDVFLFAGSVLENIRLGDASISPERVREACRAVRADEFIERLPGGYDSVLEEGGKTLSQGERQLLSFARALVTDPSILVLDEATSNVDTGTEERIRHAMRTLTRDRTSIVIAHRLSTIRHAHRIVVVDRGRIVESGTHEELLARGGAYERLHRRQFED